MEAIMKNQSKRGPRQIEYLPEWASSIEGSEHLATYNQLKKLRAYVETDPELRPAFVRLGCSTPSTPATILRQYIKKLVDEHGDTSGISIPESGTYESCRDMLANLIKERAGSDIAIKAQRALNSASSRDTSDCSQSSTWAVMVDEKIEIVRKDNCDPRAAFRWMASPIRPWNTCRDLGQIAR